MLLGEEIIGLPDREVGAGRGDVGGPDLAHGPVQGLAKQTDRGDKPHQTVALDHRQPGLAMGADLVDRLTDGRRPPHRGRGLDHQVGDGFGRFSHDRDSPPHTLRCNHGES